MRFLISLGFCGFAVVASAADAPAVPPCRVEVVEKGTDRPVPLVELRTTHHARFVSDNAGLIALDAPELMNREVWFDVTGHGYEAPKDGFGFRGVRLTPKPGGTLRVEVERKNVAKRLGRLTGVGLFAESRKLGLDGPADPHPGVFGCDSVQAAVHRGRHFFLWGDTTLAHYPLGVFHSTSATTEPGPLASLEPPVRPTYRYFTDDRGRPRGVAPMPGDGPTWLTGYVSLPNAEGDMWLVASYAKIRPPMNVYRWGLCVWNDEAEAFEPLSVVWEEAGAGSKPVVPEGHPVFWTDEAGERWVLFGNPLPTLRCPAMFEAWKDSKTWEPLTPQETLASAADGTPVRPHSGSITWNPWRKRWVTVFLEKFGKPSPFGELWYAEADAPTGPWGQAVKVLTHENYTFYNPRIHPELTPAESPVLLFEGTYTAQFADRPNPTPRYDYNQVLYRLDLDDPALAPAQVVKE